MTLQSPQSKQIASAALRVAAQADLVAITVEMLRSPQACTGQHLPAWFCEPVAVYQGLVAQAFGGCLASDPHRLATLNALQELLSQMHGLASQLEMEPWSDEYWRLFDGSQACPLNQASYIRRDKGTILGDVAGFYSAFGWQHNPDNCERPDHLLSQLEFAGMLLAMLATATNSEQRIVTAQALGQFHRLHMHDWLPSMCAQMYRATELEYYSKLSQWLLAMWSALAQAHAWPADPQPMSVVSPHIDPEDPYECCAADLVTLQAATAPAIYPAEGERRE